MFDSYPQYEYHLAQMQLIFFMLGMGATLAVSDFVRIVQQPKFLLVGAACQFLLSPLLAVLVSRCAGLEPGIAIGLILIAAMPGGPISKVFAYFGYGHVALSITLTAFGSLTAIAIVPLLLTFLAADYVPADFHMPIDRVVGDVALCLLLPLLVGMAIARFAPEKRQTFSKWSIRVGVVFVIAIIVGSLGSGQIRPGEYGWGVPVAIIAFGLLSQQVSMLPFRILGWSRPDCLSVGIEVTMRNLNLALLLKARLFPATVKGVDPVADGVLFVILFYAGAAMVMGLLLTLNFRRMARREMRIKSVAEADSQCAA